MLYYIVEAKGRGRFETLDYGRAHREAEHRGRDPRNYRPRRPTTPPAHGRDELPRLRTRLLRYGYGRGHRGLAVAILGKRKAGRFLSVVLAVLGRVDKIGEFLQCAAGAFCRGVDHALVVF